MHSIQTLQDFCCLFQIHCILLFVGHTINHIWNLHIMMSNDCQINNCQTWYNDDSSFSLNLPRICKTIRKRTYLLVSLGLRTNDDILRLRNPELKEKRSKRMKKKMFVHCLIRNVWKLRYHCHRKWSIFKYLWFASFF